MSPLMKAIYNAIIYSPMIILFAGVLLATIKLRRLPLISVLAIIAFLIRLFLDWVSQYMFGWIQSALQETQISPFLWMNYYMGWYVVRAVLTATSYILLIIVIFHREKPHSEIEEMAAGQSSTP
jgi:hypothetical protein